VHRFDHFAACDSAASGAENSTKEAAIIARRIAVCGRTPRPVVMRGPIFGQVSGSSHRSSAIHDNVDDRWQPVVDFALCAANATLSGRRRAARPPNPLEREVGQQTITQ
jgi:hypothetical protein